MKKIKTKIRHKIANKKVSRQKAKNSSHHLRIIPWTMAALAAFYLMSLIAIIRIYPEIFTVPSSYAEDQVLTTNSVSVEQQTLPDVDSIKSKLKSIVNGYGGKIFKEDFTIEFSFPQEYISRIDFLLKKDDASDGAIFPAEKKDGDKWTSRIKIGDLENDGYHLFSKIRADFPFENTWTYETPRVSVTIKNPEIATQDTTSTGTNNTQTDSTSETTTTQSDSGNIDISPDHKFLEPRGGASLSGKRVIAGAVPGAGGVEYYIIKKGSLTERYLGKARKTDAGRWKLEIDTVNIPNGEYKLFPKVSNSYGKYKGSGITIFIKNEASNSTTASSVDENEAEAAKEEIREENQTETAKKHDDDSDDSNKTIAGKLSKNIDSDQDGISDEDEKRIGTDPNSADTDKDGYMDGDEVKNGYDPLKSAKDGPDKIVFESPKEKGEVKADLIKVESIESATSENTAGFQLKGKGLSNSFITIYIYSETPTIVTVMTDENGNWAYTMDKNLDDGQHEAYVAITDNEGHITAKSEPFLFVKTAQAVTEASAEEIALRNTAAVQSPVVASRSKQVAVIGFVILISLFTSIACIGLYLVYHFHHKKESAVHKDYLAEK